MDKGDRQVVIVGAGLMGIGIAAGFVAHGVDTVRLSRRGDADGAVRRRTPEEAASLGTGQAHGAVATAKIDTFSD